MINDELTTLRISTSRFSSRRQTDEFRKLYGRAILRVEAESLSDGPIEAELVLRSMPGLAIATGSLSPIRATHTPGGVDNVDPVLIVMQSGSAVVQQRGREASVGAGEAVLTTNGEAGVFVSRGRMRAVNVRLDRAMLASQTSDLDGMILRPIHRDNHALRLLTGYVGALDEVAVKTPPELGRAFVAHVHDLVALALGASRDGMLAARSRGLRAARLSAIKADVVNNAGQRGLTVETAAARLGISPSYVRKLLDAEGTNFTALVLDLRLARTHEMLADMRYADLSISAIAYEAGFGDLSYFNRTFRRRYGMTPSDLRAAARQGMGE